MKLVFLNRRIVKKEVVKRVGRLSSSDPRTREWK